jgi:hypothetical protein
LENLFAYSNQIDQSGVWVRGNITSINSDNTIAPDQTQTADRITFTSNASGSYIVQEAFLTTGTTYTVSFFVKNSTFVASTYFSLVAYKQADVFARIEVYPSNHSGTSLYYTPASAYTGTPTFKQEQFDNDWYRYSMTFTPSANYPSGATNFTFFADSTSLNNTNRPCFIWGVQLERNSYAGYLVETTTASSYVGRPFYQYELPKQTATMVETEIVSPENGTLYYQQNLTLIENKLNIALRNEFHNMAQLKTIAIVNDRNGTKWMLGSDTGLEVTEGTAQTGLQQTDRTGYEITLTGLESYPMYGVNEALSIASGGGVEAPLPDGTSEQQSGSGNVASQQFPINLSP